MLPKQMWLCMCVFAAALLAGSAAHAGGLNLAWTNCASEGGLANLSSACDSNAGSQVLVGSFVPIYDMSGVTGVEIVVDILVGDGTSTIPAWWEIGGPGDCRTGALTANEVVNAANTICNDWANGLASGGLAAYNSGSISTIPPQNQPAHRHMVMGFAVAAADSATLLPTNEYFAFNARITNAKSLGLGACAGCTTPACMVLNSIHIVPGVNPGQFLGTGTSAASNFATWQGTGPNCQLVPTRRSSWSAVKQLYR